MVLSPNTDNIATGGGIVKNAGATSSGHSVKDIAIRGANQQSVYWGDADGFIELEGIESWKSNGDGIVIDAAANGQLRGCVSQADDGDGIKVTTTGHGMRLQENQVRNPGGGYVKLADFAVSHGNWPARRGDPDHQNQNKGDQATHNGAGGNQDGPAWYNGTDWVSLVDGSTIS